MTGELIRLELQFSSLKNSYYSKTSEKTPRYNCIAYVAGDYERPWWPVPYQAPYFWPIDNPEKDESLEEFIEAFESLGYQCCDNDEQEDGFHKIVIYIDEDGFPSHMAKQLPNGKWSSKCGDLEDIEHDLKSLCGKEKEGYGHIGRVMQKKL
jgi:hypothetical protein